MANPADDASFLRIANVPRRGLGDTSLERLETWAAAHQQPLLCALDHLDEVSGLSGRARASAAQFGELMRRLTSACAHLDLAEVGLRTYEETGYRQMLAEDPAPEGEARRQYVEQLLAFMTEFAQTNEEPTLRSFLETVALMSPVDEATEAGRVITLMTLHSAKGLEFPVVFICGMEENLFPTSRAVEESHTDPQAIEEERRLCYVGVTRARQRLYLTHAWQRYAYGSMVGAEPSRFLEELPAELVARREESEFPGARNRHRPPPARRRAALPGASRPPRGTPAPSGVHYEYEVTPPHAEGFEQFVDQDSFLAVGQWVLHPTWGRGQIVAREGNGARTKLSIRFGGHHVKRVMAAYVQLEPD
ncbi:MAG: 3'-5' exonuclease, partial [Candidatus Latescibacterota bacterium]